MEENQSSFGDGINHLPQQHDDKNEDLEMLLLSGPHASGTSSTTTPFQHTDVPPLAVPPPKGANGGGREEEALFPPADHHEQQQQQLMELDDHDVKFSMADHHHHTSPTGGGGGLADPTMMTETILNSNPTSNNSGNHDATKQSEGLTTTMTTDNVGPGMDHSNEVGARTSQEEEDTPDGPPCPLASTNDGDGSKSTDDSKNSGKKRPPKIAGSTFTNSGKKGKNKPKPKKVCCLSFCKGSEANGPMTRIPPIPKPLPTTGTAAISTQVRETYYKKLHKRHLVLERLGLLDKFDDGMGSNRKNQQQPKQQQQPQQQIGTDGEQSKGTSTVAAPSQDDGPSQEGDGGNAAEGSRDSSPPGNEDDQTMITTQTTPTAATAPSSSEGVAPPTAQKEKKKPVYDRYGNKIDGRSLRKAKDGRYCALHGKDDVTSFVTISMPDGSVYKKAFLFTGLPAKVVYPKEHTKGSRKKRSRAHPPPDLSRYKKAKLAAASPSGTSSVKIRNPTLPGGGKTKRRKKNPGSSTETATTKKKSLSDSATTATDAGQQQEASGTTAITTGETVGPSHEESGGNSAVAAAPGMMVEPGSNVDSTASITTTSGLTTNAVDPAQATVTIPAVGGGTQLSSSTIQGEDNAAYKASGMVGLSGEAAAAASIPPSHYNDDAANSLQNQFHSQQHEQLYQQQQQELHQLPMVDLTDAEKAMLLSIPMPPLPGAPSSASAVGTSDNQVMLLSSLTGLGGVSLDYMNNSNSIMASVANLEATITEQHPNFQFGQLGLGPAGGPNPGLGHIPDSTAPTTAAAAAAAAPAVPAEGKKRQRRTNVCPKVSKSGIPYSKKLCCVPFCTGKDLEGMMKRVPPHPPALPMNTKVTKQRRETYYKKLFKRQLFMEKLGLNPEDRKDFRYCASHEKKDVYKYITIPQEDGGTYKKKFYFKDVPVKIAPGLQEQYQLKYRQKRHHGKNSNGNNNDGSDNINNNNSANLNENADLMGRLEDGDRKAEQPQQQHQQQQQHHYHQDTHHHIMDPNSGGLGAVGIGNTNVSNQNGDGNPDPSSAGTGNDAAMMPLLGRGVPQGFTQGEAETVLAMFAL